MGFQLTLWDVGGGFCHDDFELAVGLLLARRIDQQFPEEMGVRIIAEAGRSFVAAHLFRLQSE